jgi:hypothetical protein
LIGCAIMLGAAIAMWLWGRHRRWF